MTEVKWIATLSDGSTAVENSGKWIEIPGERKPWVRLADFAAREKLHLTSLRVNVDGKTIHMPRGEYGRFDMNTKALAPNFYSLQYHIEAELDDQGQFGNESRFIDLAAHYDGYAVHYIQDITDLNNSWVIVSDGTNRMAVTPDKRQNG